MTLQSIEESNLITIKDFMDCVNYKITEGYDYLWKSFGNDCYGLVADDPDHQAYSISIIFSKFSHKVFLMESWDNRKEKTYRWFHPDYKDAYKNECFDKGVDYHTAHDDHRFIDLDVAQDMLEKTKAIVNGTLYDERISVPLTIPDDELFRLMVYAHERDVTLNQCVEHILEEFIAKENERKHIGE